MFSSRNKKNNVYPCKHQFYYVKVGMYGSVSMINCYFQFPVSFVINFVLPKDQALKQVEEENLSTKALITNADKQKGQSDEADKSRTQVTCECVAMHQNLPSEFPTRSDTNQAIQSLKMARCSKFWIKIEEKLHFPCNKNRGAYQLYGHRTADHRLCFCICKKTVISCRGSNVKFLNVLTLINFTVNTLKFNLRHLPWVKPQGDAN